METEKEIEKKGFDYFAFISYSHKDMKIAKRLKKRLQSYHLPTKLQKTYPTLPKKLGPIFIDEERLTGGVLQEAIRDNLDKSNYLILICSPNSAKSIYVNEEVKRFIETGRVDHIIPFIVDGVPHSGDELKECFPPALLELPLEQELLGIDLKKFGERDSFLRVIATMLELNLDNFVSYEARERKRRVMIFTPIATALMMIMGGLIWYSIEYFNFMQANDAVTQFNLGVVHHSKHDYAKAFEYYQKAASQGMADAQYNLGYLYENGLGVKQDYTKAREWFEKSAAQGKAYAQTSLGNIYYNGLEVEQDYAKALEYYQKAAAQGDVVAEFNIGYMYQYGHVLEQNYAKAMEWYEKAASQGYVSAQNNIGSMYAEGLGVKQDYDKAREWYQKAAAQGMADAQNTLGFMYYQGLGVEKDYLKAMEWYQKAAAQGNANAQNNIGVLYENGGFGVEQDYSKAMEWYQKATLQGVARAQYHIGILYLNGLGVPQNSEKAIEWLKKAAEQGDEDAKKELEKLSRLPNQQVSESKDRER